MYTHSVYVYMCIYICIYIYIYMCIGKGEGGRNREGGRPDLTKANDIMSLCVLHVNTWFTVR